MGKRIRIVADKIRIWPLITWYRSKLYGLKLKLEWQIGTSWTFLRLAWLSLISRIIIIEIKSAKSKVGHKYLAIIISKRPISKKHVYKDL